MPGVADILIDVGVQLDGGSIEDLKRRISGAFRQDGQRVEINNISIDAGTVRNIQNALKGALQGAFADPAMGQGLSQSLGGMLTQAAQGLKALDFGINDKDTKHMLANLTGLTEDEVGVFFNQWSNKATSEFEKIQANLAKQGLKSLQALPPAEQAARIAATTAGATGQAQQTAALFKDLVTLGAKANPLTGILGQLDNLPNNVALQQARLQQEQANAPLERLKSGLRILNAGFTPSQREGESLTRTPDEFRKFVSDLADMTPEDQSKLLSAIAQQKAAGIVSPNQADAIGRGQSIYGSGNTAYKKAILQQVFSGMSPSNAFGDVGRMSEFQAAQIGVGGFFEAQQNRQLTEAATAMNRGRALFNALPEATQQQIYTKTSTQQFEDYMNRLGGLDPKRQAEFLLNQGRAQSISNIPAQNASISASIINKGRQLFGSLPKESQQGIIEKTTTQQFNDYINRLGDLDPEKQAQFLLNRSRTQTLADIRDQKAAEAAAAKKPKQAGQTGTDVLKIYQRAAQFYQAGNLLSSVGLPGATQLGIVGSATQAFGPSLGMTAGVGIGAAIAGFSAAKEVIVGSLNAFAPLEQQFTRIRTLTATGVKDIALLKDQVKGLSSETGLTQVDLAKSLYFIASSGFQGAKAFNVLDASTKAAAAGLGDAGQVADIVTSVMNAYGIESKDAFTVTDKLITAIREGKAEPEQFARSLGQVLPIAREAGVGLDEVLASVAAITLQGFSAPQAITSVKQALSNLISPSKEAAEQLDIFYGYGKGISTVQENLKTNGLQFTLQDIYGEAGGNLQALDAIFGNIRGLSGVLALANGEFKKMGDINAAMKVAGGATESSWEEMSKTYEVNVKKMEAAFEAFKITMGGAFAPVIIPIIQSITTVFSGATSGDTQKSAGGLFDILEATSIPLNLYYAFAEQSVGDKDARERTRKMFLKVSQDIADAAKKEGDARRLHGMGRDMASGQEPSYPEYKPKEIGATFGAPVPSIYQMFPSEDYTNITAGFGAANTVGGSPAVLGSHLDKYRKNVKAAVDAQKSLAADIKSMNLMLADAVSSGLDQMIAAGDKRDDFFTKYADVNKKLSETPEFVTGRYQNGKLVTDKKLAADADRAANLASQIEIDKLSDKIRGARKPSKDGTINARAGLIDQKADLQLAKKEQELADLQAGQKNISFSTSDNEKYKQLLEERKQLVEDYNKETFQIAKDSFDEVLKSAAGNGDGGKEFMLLLSEGGQLLETFAHNAGMLKSTGFASEIAEAALQMKFLRGPDGTFLKGPVLGAGFAEYTKALSTFRGDLLELQKYLSGTEPLTKEIGIKLGLVGEKAKPVAGWTRTNEHIPKGYAPMDTASYESDLEKLKTPEGIMQLLFGKSGIDQGTGIKDAFQIKITAAADNIAPEMKKIGQDYQAYVDANKIAIELGVKLKGAGVDRKTVTGDDPAMEREMVDLYGPDFYPKEGSTPEDYGMKLSISPTLVLPSSGLDVGQLNIAIQGGVDKVKQEWADKKEVSVKTNVSTVVDLSTAAFINDDVFLGSGKAKVMALWDSLVATLRVPNPGSVQVPSLASGGWMQHSGMALIGENGPEYLYLPKGAGVIPSDVAKAVSGTIPNDYAPPGTRGYGSVIVQDNRSTSFTYSVDARGAEQPIRTKEAVGRALTALDIKHYEQRRARETGRSNA